MTDEAKTEQEQALEAAEQKAKEINDARTGKGTRLKVGQTRGRNPQVISYEVFDESQPDTLPKTLSEFMEITKIEDEPTIMGFVIDGMNSANYTAASDPVAEFVEATWPEDVQKAFRLVVRQYSANASVSIEDAVALIKPGIVASQAKKG
jgi:hypothetical protein